MKKLISEDQITSQFKDFPKEPEYVPPIVDKKIINQIILNFKKEACEALKIDSEEISIARGPFPFPVPMLTILPPNIDGIYINREIESLLATRHSFTPLRAEIYRQVRLIYTRRKHGRIDYKFSEEDHFDALAFSMALQLLVGLSIETHHILSLNWRSLKNKIATIIHNEFHEECELFTIQRKGLKVPSLRLRKSSKSKRNYIHSYILHPTSAPYSFTISDGTKGSKENPFDNIYEACDFILSEEKKAYESDCFLRKLSELKYNYQPFNNVYNIPWANGWITLQNNGLPRDAFILNTLLSGRFQLKPNLYGRKFLYRGQSKFYDPCTPTMFRDKNKTYFLDDVIWNIEMRQLILSHPLEKLLNLGFWMLHDAFRIEVNTYGLCQHYYGRTSLLDLTSDINAAMFFATTDYHRDDEKDIDSYTPHLECKEPGVLYYYELCMPNAFGFSQYSKTQKSHLTAVGKQVFMRCGQQHGFILDVERGMDFNSHPLVKKVFFKHDPEISKKIFRESNHGQDYFPCDALELMWKRKLKQNLTRPTVSYKTVEIDANCNKRETFQTVMRKLEEQGVHVDMSYVPHFDEDILHGYYEDIKNGWWQDIFCKDVCFAGSDGPLYKNALIDLPNQSEYKWAFYRR